MTGLEPPSILAQNLDDRNRFIVVTEGDKGARIFHQAAEYLVPVVFPETIIDPTGVGDAFRGGFLTGYSRGHDLITCGKLGALAATYCLEQASPQGHTFTLEEFTERYRNFYAEDLIL